MKKLILTAASVLMIGACNAQHTVTLKLSDVNTDTAVVMILDQNMRSVEKTDTIVGKKGTFTYDAIGDKARMAMFTFKSGKMSTRQQVYLVPGEQGTLKGTMADAKWEGKGFYGDLAKYEAQVAPIKQEMDVLSNDFQEKVKAGADRGALQQEVMPKFQALQDKLSAATLEFIKANPKSGVSAVNLTTLENPEEALAVLDPSVKNGTFSVIVKAIENRLAQEKARKEAAKSVADGCVAPDFTLKDLNGNDLALSSLRGKYLILDFWGSWCGWCIKGFPEMKNYYKKYEGKFEILGVDCNDTEDKWKAAVEKNELPWKHVYNPRTSDLAQKYAIQGYPTKIVIDPEGKIARTIVGEDPAFYTYLDQLFGEK